MTAQTHTSYRLSAEARQVLAQLAALHGVSRTAVLEILIRKAGRDEARKARRANA